VAFVVVAGSAFAQEEKSADELAREMSNPGIFFQVTPVEEVPW
jgi:hypothetical protein